ncbi:MAG: hypothetical protein NC127_05145 [Muribaculum sp.]|nr:hypothetical protein [Muribaculum sp.]
MRIIIVLLLACVATSCFTGIESTPKISDKDLSKERIIVTDEEKFLSDIRLEPFSDWKKGKLFFVTDNRINLALEPSPFSMPVAGDYLSYDRYREVPSLTGSFDTEIVLVDSKGNEFTHKVNATADELKTRDKLEIPFTIEMSVVDKTRERLKGKTFYVRTSMWYDSTGRARSGLKYIPVEIIDVEPGNTVYPVKIRFTAAGHPEAGEANVFMYVGDSSRNSRNFASLFYFSDPRKRYPQISDENWANIIHSRVAPYMTREECRLALGNPNSIDRHHGTNTYSERWNYENGISLIFDDGVLRNYRK